MNHRRLQLIKSSLDERGVNWSSLVRENEQIVLFGSWAVEANLGNADIDLFCVGHSKRKKTPLIDLICYPKEIVLSERWLGSELASHIAAFGVWLHGENTWGSKVFISERALAHKRRLIQARICGLRRLWKSLASVYRIKHVVKLRRDIQRVVLMESGKPVEPTPWLDLRWGMEIDPVGALRKILKANSEADLLAVDDLELISRYLGALNLRSPSVRQARKVLHP